MRHSTIACLAAAVVLALCFAQTALAAASPYHDGLVNKEFKRNIQLTTQLARHDYTIIVVNEGKEAQNLYYLAIPDSLAANLAQITVSDDNGNALKYTIEEKKQEIQTTTGEIADRATMVQVQLKDALAPKATVTLKVHLVFGHTMEPYPRAIAQSERQLVRYRDNHFAFSPYTTNTATTVVKLTSASIQTSSQLDPTNVKGDTITYGPYEKLKPFSHSPMMIHFENNKPFLTVARLNREIEVSHWGYINIEENHHWRNDGAELKGGFSRYEYQINPAAQGHAAIKQVDINIPRHADDVYYRDAIGNISTSHHFKTKLNIIPRFPLFGGWQTKFCMGYVTPVQDFLRQSLSDSSRFTLNITFGTAFDDDVIVDNQRVKIMLPEGATDIKVTTPFPVKESRENKITYLTWNGRPVVILEKTNLINEMNKQYFQVTYKFSSTDAYRQPLLLVGFLFAVFFALIVLSRFNPSILPDDEKAKEELLNRVRGHVKKYKELLETRSDAHQTLQRELERHVTSGGLSNFSQEKGLATRRLDDALNVATNIFTEVEKISGDLAERIRLVEEMQEAKRISQEEWIKAKLAGIKTKATSGSGPWTPHEKSYGEADKAIALLMKDLDF